jgi:hypothetical protein
MTRTACSEWLQVAARPNAAAALQRAGSGLGLIADNLAAFGELGFITLRARLPSVTCRQPSWDR